jgi:hypothetical protein
MSTRRRREARTYNDGMGGVADEDDLVVFVYYFLERRVDEVAYADRLLGETDELTRSVALIRGVYAGWRTAHCGPSPSRFREETSNGTVVSHDA